MQKTRLGISVHITYLNGLLQDLPGNPEPGEKHSTLPGGTFTFLVLVHYTVIGSVLALAKCLHIICNALQRH